MQTAGDFLQVIGLLAVLGSAALVFVNLVRWIAGKRGNQVRLGAEMLVFFSLAYGFHDEVLRFISFTAYARDVGDAMATMWWLSLAFIVNESLKRFVWLGVLSERGQRKVPRLLTDFVAVGVYLIAIMAVMHFVYEKPITAIAATSGAAAFIIGYSAQSTLGELFAGVSLNASGKLRKGDYVRIDDIYGTVHDVDWRSVTIYEYFTDSLVVFPNSMLASKNYRNYMHPAGGMRATINVTAEFTAPPNLVQRVLVEALQGSRFVLRDPPPFVFPLGPNELGIEYIVGFSFPSYMNWFETQDEALNAIWIAFRRHDIRPGLNHRFAVHGSEFDGDGWPARQAARDAAALPAFLAEISLLQGLDAAALSEIARQSDIHDFTPPECIVAKGAGQGRLFLVQSGSVELMTTDADGEDFSLAHLMAGDVFGESTLPAADADQVRAQMGAYGAIVEITADVLASHADVQARLAAIREARAGEFEGRRKAHAYEVRRRQRERDKSQIAAGLGSRLGGVLKAGMFGGAKTKRRRERLLEAAMAATALVAYADGVIEPEERAQVIETLDELDILRQAGADEGIKRFDDYAAKLEADTDTGTRDAMAEVTALKDDAALARMVVDICIAVSAADGEIEEPEEARIAEIEQALGITPTA
jgi:small-conductance mechanosensitive channel/tellurite resistance protein/CRP-like cAMP-binding protein